MGTSTVSGPFRSQNGFEQLVNGEWVPVSGGGSPLSLTTTGTSGPATLVGSNLNIPNYATGGGGGGSLAIPITNVPSATTTTTLPALEIGESVTYVTQFTSIYPTSGFSFIPPVMSGVDLWYFIGITSRGGSVNTLGGENSLSLPQAGYATLLWQVTCTRGPDVVYEGNTIAVLYTTAWGYQG